ncbi:nucleotidyltransferase domain-containing protein [Streptomyces lunaelactis]|uniref:nucleotidyltransferase domain-containing protein n=1 Tax=Streptomyces lunaelactis TaxID=1535768 RepID=UPI0020C79489|nr:nucleotidyltransferase domain-containing protein [Streptomyces lunaelactis]
MLQRLDEGGSWPLELVDAVYVFGSYARGALEPGDVDVAVDFRQDERMKQRTVAYLVSGGISAWPTWPAATTSPPPPSGAGATS